MIDFELFFEYYRGASLLCANSFGFRWRFIHFRIVLNGFCSLNPLAPVSPTNKHVVPNTSACILNILIPLSTKNANQTSQDSTDIT